MSWAEGAAATAPAPASDCCYACRDDERALPRPNDREARKLAEKKRRTVLNALVQELSGLLPLVSESSRKIDKTGVLRLAAHEIRKDHVFGETAGRVARPFGRGTVDAFLDLVDGFLLTVTMRGIVVVVSPNVQQHLGHSQLDLLGRSLFDVVHPDDARALRHHLAPKLGSRHEFAVRICRGGCRNGDADSAQWSWCRVRGAFRPADRAGRIPATSVATGAQRRQRARRDRLLNPHDNDVVFVALVCVARPVVTASFDLNVDNREYVTRHLIDGRIVQCDYRISLVAGYLANEVTGVSAFAFMHKDDVRWAIVALRRMYDQGNPRADAFFRLVDRTGKFIYMRSHGQLEINPVTKVAESLLCVNARMDEEEGKRAIEETKSQLSAIIGPDANLAESFDRGVEAVEHPQNLEPIVMHLITNLSSPSSDTQPSEEQLTIVPPPPSSVKPSLERAFSITSETNSSSRGSPASSSDSAHSPL